MMIIDEDPAERLPRIERIWAFLSIDNDGDEGICAAVLDGKWWPLIAADEKRLEVWRPVAKELAATLAPSGKRIVLARFFGREDQETF